MGTRADFYIGRGPTAEWIGSLPLDGYPEGIDAKVLACQSVEAFSPPFGNKSVEAMRTDALP